MKRTELDVEPIIDRLEQLGNDAAMVALAVGGLERTWGNRGVDGIERFAYGMQIALHEVSLDVGLLQKARKHRS